MNIIVSDTGFAADDWHLEFHPVDKLDELIAAELPALALELDNDFEAELLAPVIHRIDLIKVNFPTSADGRGFSLATQLRMLGFQGRLRAAGHVIADQYAMARRSGFDEVEISEALARRQPEPQWLARSDWQDHFYQQRLRQFA